MNRTILSVLGIAAALGFAAMVAVFSAPPAVAKHCKPGEMHTRAGQCVPLLAPPQSGQARKKKELRRK